jgi:hypothetical protein
MSDTYLYFAYGSNMLSKRLQAPDRAPSAEVVSVASISDYRLTFDKQSRGSGKCDMEYTGKGTDQVYGVIYRIAKTDEVALDRAEGRGYGYDKVDREFVVYGQTLVAATYLATKKDASLLPFDWYKEHVVRGAREQGLPAEYIRQIEATPSQQDPDQERASKERSLW